MNGDGFMDPATAQLYQEAFSSYAQRIRDAVEAGHEEDERRHASIIRGQAELLLELIDQRIRRERLVHKPFGLRFISKLLDFSKHFRGDAGETPLQDPQQGGLEGVGGLESDLLLAAAIFKHPDTVLSAQVHGASNPVSTAGDANSAAGSPHRLSGDPI